MIGTIPIDLMLKEVMSVPMNNDARTAWNSKNYTQIKIYTEPGLAAEFKAACAAKGVSMASVLSQAMANYCKRKPTKKPIATAPDYSTRGKRRTAFHYYVEQLEAIKDAEEEYKDNIPDNLHNGEAYENADQTVTAMEDGLGSLSSAFQ